MAGIADACLEIAFTKHWSLTDVLPPSSGSTSPTETADEQCSFLVVKHSWKGKYKRVFCVGQQSVTTYNPR